MPDSNCCFLACIHFLRRWSDIPISLRIFWFSVIHTVKGFSVVNKPEVDVFLEFSCFLYDPTNVGNLVSGSSAFSKPSLYIWKFLAHVLLKVKVVQLCLTLCDFMDYIIHGILQARILE